MAMTQFQRQRALEAASGPDRLVEEFVSSHLPVGVRGTGSDERRISALMEYMKRTHYVSLAPLLPVLLTLKGMPYTLKNHYHFYPVFRTRVPQKMLWLTGRQVSKSTSMAGKEVVRSATIPYYSTLCVTPLFEQTRRFSHNYVRPFIEHSPVRQLLVGENTINSVLQRSFKNGSILHFTFAFLDAERARGISADSLAIDESLCGTTTYVETTHGRKLISQVSPGETLTSFGLSGNVTWTRIKKVSYHGFRACWRLRTASGRLLDLTAESWVATREGWMRVSQIIDRIARGQEAAAESGTEAANPGNDAGRWLYRRERPALQDISVESRLETARVQLDQIPDIVRIRLASSQEAEESRLRRVVELLRHPLPACVRLLQRPMLSPHLRRNEKEVAMAQDSDPRMVGPVDVGRGRMVGLRRRQSLRHFHQHQHAWLLEGGSRAASELAARARDRVLCPRSSQEGAGASDLLDDRLYGPRDLDSDQEDQSVCPGLHEIQDHDAGTTDDQALCGVRADLHDAGYYPRPRSGGSETTDLSLQIEILSPGMQSRSKPEIPRETGEESGEKSLPPEAISRKHREISRKESHEGRECDERSAVPKSKKYASERVETEIAREETAAHRLLSNLRLAADRQGSEYSVLPSMPSLENEGTETSLRGREEKGQTRSDDLVDDELISIEYIGYHDVYDIETDTGTFLANGLAVHNCQDLAYEFLPVLRECLSGSEWKTEQFSGTPKSLDNTINKLWCDSSQAEWLIPCMVPGCGHWNIPSLAHDLLDMIGPWRDDICEQRPGLVCAKCRKPLQPRLGHWVHAFAERRFTFPGYHLSQTVTPIHCAKSDAWKLLVHKRHGGSNTPFHTFLNEVCGVSYDLGTRLVTQTDIERAACLPWNNKVEEAVRHIHDYSYRILAVDWSGMGDETFSYTCLAVMGLLPNGNIDVLWGHRSLRTYDPEYEADLIIAAIDKFECGHMVHDYTGAGSLRELLVAQKGMPFNHIMAFSLGQAAKHGLLVRKPPTPRHPREWYLLDKSRSLLQTCHMIRDNKLRFFRYDYRSADDPGLLHDFLALYEEKTERKSLGELYAIRRSATAPDDFAQAVNLGCFSLFQLSGKWPDFSKTDYLYIDPSILHGIDQQLDQIS